MKTSMVSTQGKKVNLSPNQKKKGHLYLTSEKIVISKGKKKKERGFEEYGTHRTD